MLVKKQITLSDLDCIFISYDEPNAEKNWSDLRNKCMWAERVHGVKGSDECHKQAAYTATTEWFITVDADNIVDPAFFNQTIDVPTGALAFSWPGVNIINGLRYGNGSLKVWRRDFVMDMKTHEAADKDSGAVDFCWEDGYRPMTDTYSTTYPNASAYQAWRAGFREGVKMSLVDGVLPEDPAPAKMFWHNLQRLKVWMSVGAHVENGLWAILGARHGAYKTNCTDWNYVDVRDFDALAEIYKEVEDQDPLELINYYGNQLSTKFGLTVPVLDADASAYVVEMFKDQYQQVLEQVTWTMKRNAV